MQQLARTTQSLPESPDWKTSHASLRLVRWTGGWVATGHLWRHNRADVSSLEAGEAMRTWVCEWPHLSPVSRMDLITMLWRTCHHMAHQAARRPMPLPTIAQIPRLPGEMLYVDARASLISTATQTTLHAYLIGKGSSARHPVETRVCNETLMTVKPLCAEHMFQTLGYLIEQHSR